MKAVIVLVIGIALGLAACSSDDETPAAGSDGTSGGSGAPAAAPAAPPPTSKTGVGGAESQKLITNAQSKQTCDWFTELINDVNAGLISGVEGDVVSVGETRYRIKNMYGLSIGSQEPIHPSVKTLMAATQLEFKFEDVLVEVDALRDACAQNGFEVPELATSEEM